MRAILHILLTALVLSALSGCSKELPPEKRADDNLRITVEKVKSWLDEGRDVLFVDIRAEMSWRASDRQIPGSVRVQSYQGAETLAQTLDKGRVVVAYCT